MRGLGPSICARMLPPVFGRPGVQNQAAAASSSHQCCCVPNPQSSRSPQISPVCLSNLSLIRYSSLSPLVCYCCPASSSWVLRAAVDDAIPPAHVRAPSHRVVPIRREITSSCSIYSILDDCPVFVGPERSR